jgi:hypothetical protein
MPHDYQLIGGPLCGWHTKCSWSFAFFVVRGGMLIARRGPGLDCLLYIRDSAYTFLYAACRFCACRECGGVQLADVDICRLCGGVLA